MSQYFLPTVIQTNFSDTKNVLTKKHQSNIQTYDDCLRVSKTLKTSLNLIILQRQSDSVRDVLNNSIQILAELDEKIPNSNPLLKTNKTPFQKAAVDVQANTAIFAELVKQLEIAKISHRNNTPLIQIIDSPIYPLENSRWNLPKTLVYGFFLGISLMSFYFISLFLFRNNTLQ